MSNILLTLVFLFLLWIILFPQQHNVPPELEAAAVRLVHNEMAR